MVNVGSFKKAKPAINAGFGRSMRIQTRDPSAGENTVFRSRGRLKAGNVLSLYALRRGDVFESERLMSCIIDVGAALQNEARSAG